MASSAHPYTGYNKPELRGTLVGNWVEENALKDVTGDHRYTGWVPPPTQAQEGDPVYAKKVAPPRDIDTFSRVFAHTDNLLVSDWRTNSQSAFQQPTSRDDELRKLVASGLGQRTALALLEMQKQAAVLAPGEALTAPPPLRPDYITMTAGVHSNRGPSETPVGRRVLKTQDGDLIGMDRRDRTFLAETGLVPKADADRIGQTVLEPRDFGSYVVDVPVTIYTQKNQEGKLPGTGVFPASCVAGPNPNPFGKNNAFSLPVRDPFKTVSDE